jgi:hypothetical protein
LLGAQIRQDLGLARTNCRAGGIRQLFARPGDQVVAVRSNLNTARG